MARFTFVTWVGAGSQPPALGIGQELASRGHDVRFLGYARQRKRLEGRGFAFDSLARSGGTDWQSIRAEERFAVLFGKVFANREHLDDLADALVEHTADLLVVDCLLFGIQAAAELLGTNTAGLVHSAPGAMAAVNGVRLASGLPAVNSLVEAWAKFPAVVSSIRELDVAAGPLPGSFEYVGPETLQWDRPSDWDESLPLVLASFTTSAGWDQTSRIQSTIDGLAGQPYRVLVTNAQADRFSVPANAAIRGYVPHAAVLPGAAITVTHASHGPYAPHSPTPCPSWRSSILPRTSPLSLLEWRSSAPDATLRARLRRQRSDPQSARFSSSRRTDRRLRNWPLPSKLRQVRLGRRIRLRYGHDQSTPPTEIENDELAKLSRAL
jgi:UDP:flavonoid glycosyltransferase YjiC (YdhE family)